MLHIICIQTYDIIHISKLLYNDCLFYAMCTVLHYTTHIYICVQKHIYPYLYIKVYITNKILLQGRFGVSILSLLILHNFTRDPQLPSSPSNMHGHTRVGRRFKLGISEVLKHDGRLGVKWKYIRQRIQLKEVYELNIRVYSIRQNGFRDEVKLCYVYLRYVDIRLYIYMYVERMDLIFKQQSLHINIIIQKFCLHIWYSNICIH